MEITNWIDKKRVFANNISFTGSLASLIPNTIVSSNQGRIRGGVGENSSHPIRLIGEDVIFDGDVCVFAQIKPLALVGCDRCNKSVVKKRNVGALLNDTSQISIDDIIDENQVLCVF